MDDNASGHDRLEVLIGVLIALAAVTAALTAWRVSVVSSQADGSNRSGLLDTVKVQAMRNVTERTAYGEARYAVSAALESAAADALARTGRPVDAAYADKARAYLVPNLGKLAGDLPSGRYTTQQGPFDVDAYVDALLAQDDAYTALDPAGEFALATDYANEERLLTVVGVVLAIALFWLGLAEITRGRGRIVNLSVGVLLWVGCLAVLGVIEATAVSGRGGVW